MKAIVLIAQQYDKSGFKVLRVYLSPHLNQADKDAEMLKSVSDMEIMCKDAEVYEQRNDGIDITKLLVKEK